MPRQLPRNKSDKHKLIIEAVDDYFGPGCPIVDRPQKKDIALWLMGRRKGVRLSEEQKNIKETIRTNISDPVYRESLLLSPIITHSRPFLPHK